uniref:Monocarboxylate transporter 12-B-like n=1 Tax=Saccoglossus kowalevskii TaxID=10224 RepID=A0ABM0MYR7_SACKO|nr:PREDICTED: monocarboxylate transporter 12-B-like [Saccoglossus kowalevskii]
MPASTQQNVSSALRLPPIDPPDGGYGWVIVLASFLLFTLLAGDFFHLVCSWIGSLFFGVGIISNAISLALSNKFGHRPVVITGGVLSACGLVLSAFTTTIHQLYFTYGVFTSLAFWLLPVPSLALVGKYFKKRLSMAVGLALAGTGAGQFLFSLVIQILLDTYGWRGTMIVLGGLSLNICVAGALFRPLEGYQTKVTLEDRGYKEINRPRVRINSSDSHSRKNIAARYAVIQEVSEESDADSVDGIVFTTKGCSSDSVPHNLNVEHEISYRDVELDEHTKTKKSCCCRCKFLWNKFGAIFRSMYDVTLFKSPVFLLVMLTVFGYSSSQYAIIAHVYQCYPDLEVMHMQCHQQVKRGRDFGIPSLKSSSLPAMMGLTQCFGRIFWGVGGALLKVKPYILYGAGMGIGGLAAIVSVYIRNYEGQLAFVLIFGLCMACYIPMLPVVLHYFLGADKLDHSLSMTMQMQGLAAMLGSPFAGWMRDIQGDYDGAFYSVGSLLIVSSILAFITPYVNKHLVSEQKKSTVAVITVEEERTRTLSMSESLATLDHLTAM